MILTSEKLAGAGNSTMDSLVKHALLLART